ncbi:M56 family metallopeptidase [Edaphobacter aggregans]|uniref:M56 family metallopeptidase n=1 Tax=Edaphobacter aggregans TaxID=570835 RepID=UPI00054DFEA3|nr:M56 family metallopeptidase [Edaphobacter aggregans]
MTNIVNILPQLARLAAETFVAGLWQGLAFIAAIAICLALLSRISASVRFAIWFLTFALVVAIPLLHLRTPASSTEAPSSAILHLSPTIAIAIAALWAALTVARVTQLFLQTLKLRRIANRSRPVTESESIAEVLTGTRRPVVLCTSPDVDSPCVIGFLTPRLLVPESLFAKLTKSELHQIVLHECEHLRRHDDWTNLAQKIAVALFPLNPALLLVDRRLSLERELACDAGVIARTAAPFDYAHCLTRLAECRLHTRRLSLAVSAWSRQSELARRVHTLLKPIARLSPAYARASVATLSVMLLGGAVELTHAPHLVSFTNTSTVPVASGVDTFYREATPKAIPVLYNPTSEQPHATLLKATVSTAKPTSLITPPSTKKPRPTRFAKPQQPGLLRTAAPQHKPAGRYSTVQAYYVTTTEISPSYAAVPFGDGWLIIQL